MYNQVISAAKKPELATINLYPGEDGFCDGPSTIEFAPHNTLYTWIGLGLNPELVHMGAFYLADFDPCFYLHHINVDQIWDIWMDIHGKHIIVGRCDNRIINVNLMISMR